MGAKNSPDREIAALAARQHGVVSRRQLLALGLGPRAIAHRLEAGRLHSLHRGVYAVGHRRLPSHGRWMAAVLAGGPGAALSHRSAAALWRLLPDAGGRIEVTVPRTRAGRPGLVFHRGGLPAAETTVIEEIRVTTVARTLLDVAAAGSLRQVERALQQAEVLGVFDLAAVEAALAASPRRPGSRTVRATLARRGAGAGITRSELEERFLALTRRSRLPVPGLNVAIRVGCEWVEADCAWARRRLIVELDGRAVHGTAAAFESDRARDRRLAVAGWRVVRITWRQLRDEPGRIAADLRALLT